WRGGRGTQHHCVRGDRHCARLRGGLLSGRVDVRQQRHPVLMSVAVSVQDLEFRVGDREILRSVNLEVAPGEIVAIMGVSGSGKTSLLKCMAGLQRATSGKILIGDVDLNALDETRLNEQRRKIGMVFQYAALFDSLTVFENVVFGLRF